MVSATSGTSSGDPGPFEISTPSGLNAIICSAEVFQGTTVTLQLWEFRLRTILYFIPQSIATISYL